MISWNSLLISLLILLVITFPRFQLVDAVNNKMFLTSTSFQCEGNYATLNLLSCPPIKRLDIVDDKGNIFFSAGPEISSADRFHLGIRLSSSSKKGCNRPITYFIPKHLNGNINVVIKTMKDTLSNIGFLEATGRKKCNRIYSSKNNKSPMHISRQDISIVDINLPSNIGSGNKAAENYAYLLEKAKKEYEMEKRFEANYYEKGQRTIRLRPRSDEKISFDNGVFKLESETVCAGKTFTVSLISQGRPIKSIVLKKNNKEEVQVLNNNADGLSLKTLTCRGKKNDCRNYFTFTGDNVEAGSTYQVIAEMDKARDHISPTFNVQDCKYTPEGTTKQETPKIILNNDFLLITNHICRNHVFSFSTAPQKCRILSLDLMHTKTDRTVDKTEITVQGDWVESVPCQVKDKCRNFFDLSVPGHTNYQDEYHVKMRLAKANDRNSTPFRITNCTGLIIEGVLLQQPPVPGPRLGGVFTFLSNKACRGGVISVRVRGNKATINWLAAFVKNLIINIAVSIIASFLPGIGQVVGAVGAIASVASSVANIAVTVSKLALTLSNLASDLYGVATSKKGMGVVEYVMLTYDQKTEIHKVYFDHYGNSTLSCDFMTDEGCNMIVDLFIDPERVQLGKKAYQVVTKLSGIGDLRSNKFEIEDCGRDPTKYYFRYPDIYGMLVEKEKEIQNLEVSVKKISELVVQTSPEIMNQALENIYSVTASTKEKKLVLGLMFDYGLDFGTPELEDTMFATIKGNTTIKHDVLLMKYVANNIENMIEGKTFNNTINNDIDPIEVSTLTKKFELREKERKRQSTSRNGNRMAKGGGKRGSQQVNDRQRGRQRNQQVDKQKSGLRGGYSDDYEDDDEEDDYEDDDEEDEYEDEYDEEDVYDDEYEEDDYEEYDIKKSHYRSNYY